jgi:hypothetical protein
MKILRRNTCEWVDVKFNFERGYIYDLDNNIIYDYEILATENDERDKYVKCLGCGEMVRNTKKAIKDHQDIASSSNHCLTCRLLRRSNTELKKEKYTLNPDGTYTYTMNSTCKLVCANTYYSSPDINSEDARKKCRYASCAEKGVGNSHYFFGEYPDAFDYLATVDALDEKTWEFVDYSRRSCSYKARKRFCLNAFINCKGIIYEFYTTYRNRSLRFVYSKKYDQIFWICGREYKKTPEYVIPETRIQEIKALVAKIYHTEEN